MCVSRLAIVAVIAACIGAARAQLVINEVFYNVSPQGGNQFIELYNAGTNTAYLDGLIITDEAGNGTEGVFKFPGTPGGTTLAVPPGGYVVIAVDATNATASANWECYAGPPDSDNPSVPNLVLVDGAADLGLFQAGDGVILANGLDTTIPIAPATVLDGVNFGGGDGELAPLGPNISDPNPFATAPVGFSIGRCPNGVDNNTSSAGEFYAMTPTPGAANQCGMPVLFIFSLSVTEGNAGAVTASVPVTLSQTSAMPVTVQFFTSNGTAVAGSDYTATNGVLTFPPGTWSNNIRVVVLSDTTPEGDEQFTVRLINPTNASLGTAIATVTIVDDDGFAPAHTGVFLSVAGAPPAMTTRWESVSGMVYRLEASPTLLNPLWSPISSPVTATAPLTTLVDTNAAATTRFYRVITILP